jgi:hypothetical protein
MHIIRLRGPWQLEPIWRLVLHADGTYRPERENLPAAARMTMPADWSAVFGADFLGRVQYRRVFHRPTGLEGGARVYLVVEWPRSSALVELNRKRLGHVSSGAAVVRFDITELMVDDNSLEIVVDHPALDADCKAVDDAAHGPGGLVGEVRLEIEE